MSDFLDRLATRAIGHEPMLEPRRPALFEPAQRAPVVPPTGDETGVRENRHEGSAAISGMTSASPAKPAPVVLHEAVEPTRRVASRRDAAPAAQQPSSEPSPAIAHSVATRLPRSPVAADEHATVAVTTALPRSQLAPAPVPPRERHVTPSRPDVDKPPRAAVGVLLPAPPSGITSSRVFEPGGNVSRVAGTRAGHSASDSARNLPSEPVVHVSIGRIEVRAAPAITAAPRARDAARPSSLDDYLRQRSGKAAS